MGANILEEIVVFLVGVNDPVVGVDGKGPLAAKFPLEGMVVNGRGVMQKQCHGVQKLAA